MNLLDDPKTLALDASGMLTRIKEMGPELERAWHESAGLELPEAAYGADNVVVAGQGGSATAGDYLDALCAISAELPVAVVRGYALPNYVSESSLVVVSSYSGNTEEALACYDDAWKRGATIIVSTTGGALAERAAADGVLVQRIMYGAAPRAATAHSLAPLLRLGTMLGLCEIEDEEVGDASAARARFIQATGEEVPTTQNPAKQLAIALAGRFAIVMGAEHLAPVASRFKNQLAENAKMLGGADTLPEADHNLVVGLGTAELLGRIVELVTMESAMYDRRNQARFEVTAGLFKEAKVRVHRLQVEGDSHLAQLLVGTAWGDYVSCYLAFLNGVDPTPVPQIVKLKEALADMAAVGPDATKA